MFDRPNLGRILISHGAVSEEQLDAALAYQQVHNCRLGQALVRMGLCTELEIARALAEQMELPFIDLQQTPPAPRILRLLSKEIAEDYGVVPVRMEGERLVVAARNPLDIRLDEVIRKATGLSVLVGSTCESQLRDIVRRYDELKWMGAPKGDQVGRAAVTSAQEKAAPGLVAATEQSHTVQMVDSLIAHAVRRGATEISFEPQADGLHVRGRIDGHMYPMAVVPKERASSVVARVKIMAGIPLDQEYTSQQGACNLRVDGRSVELAANTLRGANGEIVVLRSRPGDRPIIALQDLGLETGMLRILRRALVAREGLILVGGPVDSGRTTTLYALLGHLVAEDAKVVSVEHEPQSRILGVNQLVTPDLTGQAFIHTLQLALNQDPDVLMVSELPDQKTAELICRAASRGRLILCGSHSRTSLAAIARLLDLGIAPNAAASALSVVVAQSLLRRLCDNCGTEHSISFDLDRALRGRFGSLAEAQFQRGRGCAQCHQMGTRGRIGVFEVLEVDEDLRHLLSDRRPPSAIEEYAHQHGYQSLEEDAFQKACQGLIAPEEILHLRMGLASTVDETAPPRRRKGDMDRLSAFSEPDPVPEPDIPEASSWDELAGMVDALS
jgi:type II secretory ATPase GspE/PulE/Tfp pilus assembly ATPase PilB-like protein